MFRKTVTSLIALSTAVATFSVAWTDTSAATLHASASTLQERTAERRAARLVDPAARRWITRPRESSAEQRRAARLRRRGITTPVTPPAESRDTLLERRDERRESRLQGRPIPLAVELTDAVNFERAKMGIAPLMYNMKLELSAQRHAEDMKTRNFFSHENPEGERSGDRIKKTGYGVINAQECRCSYKVFLGENIAKGQATIPQVIREWMASQSHREAILSRDYKEIGVGKVEDIWVLNFGGVETSPAGR